jgi:hypothetical protein
MAATSIAKPFHRPGWVYEEKYGKDEASPYREGRTLSWPKVKVPKYREGERGWDPKGTK